MKNIVENIPILVRPYADGDLAAADRLVEAAFGKPSAPPLASRLAVPSTHAFIAQRESGTVAGFTTLSVYGKIAYIGSMAVDPQSQHAGTGKALMTALLAHCRDHDIPSIGLDATDAGAPLYAQFGFVQIDRTIVCERVAPFLYAAGKESNPDDLALAIAMDRELLGCDRSQVLTMFANIEGSTVTADEDGYAICWGETIGPVVATSPYGARAVIGRALRNTAAITRMLIPENTPDALEIASAHGFTIARTCAHMARGESPFTREAIFARASHSYG